MTTSPKSIGSRVIQELWIFAGIVVLTMVLMNVRWHHRVIEQNRGMIRYEYNVDKADAIRMSRELANLGMFDGVPRSFQLLREGETHQMRFAVAAQTLESKHAQVLLAEALLPVGQRLFGERPVEIWLTDDTMAPKLQLKRSLTEGIR